MTYTQFLKGLAALAEKLDEAAKLGADDQTGVATPYLAGQVEVRLDGIRVGYFEFEDEWVIWHEDRVQRES